jgi:hypothetical protein
MELSIEETIIHCNIDHRIEGVTSYEKTILICGKF